MSSNQLMLLGPHIKREKFPDQQRFLAVQSGFGAFQTHWGNPRTSIISDHEYELKFSNPKPEKDPIWVIHTAYTTSANPSYRNKDKVARYLINLINQSYYAGVKYIVLHVGAVKNLQVEWVSTNICSFLEEYYILEALSLNKDNRKVKLLIENMASVSPFNVDLKNLINVTNKYEDVGWCLDLCHAYAAGISFKDLQEAIDLCPPDVSHINFPGSKFGSGKDRHGWRTTKSILNNQLNYDSLVSPQDIISWDSIVKYLYSLRIPLILEGGSFPGVSMKEELSFIRSMLQPEESI